MSALFRRQSYGITVTLTTANTNYSIYELVEAITKADTPPTDTPSATRELTIQAYPGIDGAGANTNDILVGDSELSTTRIGYVLSPGQSRTYRGPVNNVNLGGIYVRSAGTAQKLNVEIQGA